MKPFVLSIVVILFSVSVTAKISIDTKKVQKAVVFLYAATPTGEVDKDKPIGTGFLVFVPAKSDPTQGYLILLTARHMVDPTWQFCGVPNPQRVFVRLNKKQYDAQKDATGVDYVPIQLTEAGQAKYVVDRDEQIDAAAILISTDLYPRFDKDDFGVIPVGVFATPEEIKNLSIGDAVLSAGLLPGLSGENRNYPFFKFGNISNIPDEPLPSFCREGVPPRLLRAWYLAVNLVGGNSGSPVFYFPAGPAGMLVTGPGSVDRPVFIGIQSASLVAADIAGMTPVQYVFGIIERMNLANADLYRGEPDKKPK
jgi:hypothetical protein